MSKRTKRPARQPNDDRHLDFGEAWHAPDPDGLVRDLLEQGRTSDDGRKPHDWGIRVVYELAIPDEEIHDLAVARAADPEFTWHPAEMTPARVEGPYCLSCDKLRGPLPAQTWCGEAKPAWLKRHEAELELKLLPRDQRRQVDVRRRRESRRVLAATEEIVGAPSPSRLARSLTMRQRPVLDGLPETVTLDDPGLALPELAAVS